jgi:hypothetical protein
MILFESVLSLYADNLNTEGCSGGHGRLLNMEVRNVFINLFYSNKSKFNSGGD